MLRSFRSFLVGWLFLGLSAGLSVGCLDSNELTTRDLGVTPSSEYVDVGIPLDPRTSPDAGGAGEDGGGSDPDASPPPRRRGAHGV